MIIAAIVCGAFIAGSLYRLLPAGGKRGGFHGSTSRRISASWSEIIDSYVAIMFA